MAKGDRITVLSQMGSAANAHTIEARQNGRVVDIEFDKDQGVSWLIVTEKTRGGTLVRKDRFLVSAIVSVTEEYGD